MKKKENLTPEEKQVIIDKGTEYPFSGEYVHHKAHGIYCCKVCGKGLYCSEDKFESSCGWPAFDDEIPNAVKHIPDSDGRRTEIVCANCKAHLGHVFEGERFTDKDIRHCVNSISMEFVPDADIEAGYFASGCFWGTEYFLQKAEGVIYTRAGFMGGRQPSPSYEEVCTEMTGHVETVKVIFDRKQISYEDLVKLFFETHDFSQFNRQGPDIGTRYRSVLFCNSEEQKTIAKKYINLLEEKGFTVATEIETASEFWDAETYHQHYYDKKSGMPYCHVYRKIF